VRAEEGIEKKRGKGTRMWVLPHQINFGRQKPPEEGLVGEMVRKGAARILV